MKGDVAEKSTFYVNQPIHNDEFKILVDKLEFWSNDDDSIMYCRLPKKAAQDCGMFFDIEVYKCYDYEDFEPTETLGYYCNEVRVYVPLTDQQIDYLKGELKKMGAVCTDIYDEELRKRYANAIDDMEQGLWGYGY